MEAVRSEPKTVISARKMYDKLVALKENMLQELQPIRSDGRTGAAPVWIFCCLSGLC